MRHLFCSNVTLTFGILTGSDILSGELPSAFHFAPTCAADHPYLHSSSGSRIIVTLLHLLKKGEYGVAAICNVSSLATRGFDFGAERLLTIPPCMVSSVATGWWWSFCYRSGEAVISRAST